MPELPEVETIRRFLRQGRPQQPAVLGREIARAQLLWPRTLAAPDGPEFQQRIRGQVVQEVSRRAKYLVLDLSTGHLLIHLRMSGDLRVEPASQPFQPHDRFALEFVDGWRLSFNDTRKFGRVWLVDDTQTLLGQLGPEPLAEEFRLEEFQQRLARTQRALKPLLLDQHFIAGLGNIYTDEALHRAGLHPLMHAAQLSPDQVRRLYHAIRQVLRAGIEAQGASIDWVYRGGGFQNEFRVYQRSDQPCLECGTPIQRIVVGQRGTHFCPNCQPSGGRSDG